VDFRICAVFELAAKNKENIMEYVIVEFSSSRKVYVDGRESGSTNTIFRIGAGRHDFHLGTPLNYYPRQIRELVEGTNALAPKVIHFDPLPPS
jgi:hypothetical protein